MLECEDEKGRDTKKAKSGPEVIWEEMRTGRHIRPTSERSGPFMPFRTILVLMRCKLQLSGWRSCVGPSSLFLAQYFLFCLFLIVEPVFTSWEKPFGGLFFRTKFNRSHSTMAVVRFQKVCLLSFTLIKLLYLFNMYAFPSENQCYAQQGV